MHSSGVNCQLRTLAGHTRNFLKVQLVYVLVYEIKLLNKSNFIVSIVSENEMTLSNSLCSVTIHSLSMVVSYQMTPACKIKSTLEWIISNSNENIMCS